MLIDLQLRSIHRDLRVIFREFSGVVLDVGGGRSPWNSLLPPQARYAMIDIADGFNMCHSNCAFFDGDRFPVRSDSCAVVLSIEVLEHVANLKTQLSEIFRVLQPGGKLVATTPWSARMHYQPHDYRRLSRFGLIKELESAGFVIESIKARGSYFSVISNKLIVKILEKRKRTNGRDLMASFVKKLLLLLLIVPFLLVTQIFALIAESFGVADEVDPLGWTIVAAKPGRHFSCD